MVDTCPVMVDTCPLMGDTCPVMGDTCPVMGGYMPSDGGYMPSDGGGYMPSDGGIYALTAHVGGEIHQPCTCHTYLDRHRAPSLSRALSVFFLRPSQCVC